ncbi:MAG: LCP family protein [Candidatus Levyibacteriota bacterium]
MVKNRKFPALIIGVVLIGVLFLLVLRFFPLFWGVFIDKKIALTTKSPGNINVLLLGIGGGTHDGPDLTDTIILANIQLDTKKINLISIPRDLYVKALGSKINAAYATGQEKGNKGILLAKSTVNMVTGVMPDYTLVLDFSGFVKLVDLLGGIDVQVKNTLDDYAYPVEGKEQELCGVTQDGIASLSAQIATGSATEFDLFPCRFTHLHVDSGMQHMNGILALEFVRSRHAMGQEGTDFARSARQQLVIDAVRNKILSLGTLANPVKVFGMIDLLKQNINTDIPEDQYDDFIKLAQSMRGAKILSHVLDIGDTQTERYGLLVNPPISSEYAYQWVLAPRIGGDDFSEVHAYVACILADDVCEVTKTSVVDTKPTIAPTGIPSSADQKK